VQDGKSITFTSRSRNSKGYIKLLKKIERAIPKGVVHVIADTRRATLLEGRVNKAWRAIVPK
jgi:hypothetical protein